MKKLAILFYLALFSGLFLLMSCDNDDDGDANMMEEVADDNIVATAQATADLSLLVDALLEADEDDDYDFVETLSGEGPFTVFAPTNTAFTALLEELDGYSSLDDFASKADKDILATILQYHVVAGAAAFSTDLSDGQMITTLLGDDITVRLDGGVFIDDASDVDAEVVIPDVEASNGVVHVIDKVLLPQAVIDAINAQTIVDVAVATDDLSSLVAALIQADAGLVETLSGDGPFTVFAPTNAAFTALLGELDGYASLEDFTTEADKEVLTTILTYHVVAGAAAFSTDLSDGQMVTTVQGESLTISLNGGVFIDDATDVNAEVIMADVEASNGVVHVIDKVLLPEAIIDALNAKTIVDLALETEELSSLVSALVQADAGLVETLSGDGPFTVFAPTNAAFTALLGELDGYASLEDFTTEADKEVLTTILTYHVVAGAAAFSTDLSDGQMVTTVQGESLTISLNGGVFIDDATDVNAEVIMADVEASNGVVHVIDKVLLPEAIIDALNAKTIVDLALETEELSSLVSALVQADAGLVETLSGDGPFTVFAPTNAAFAALLDALGPNYNSLEDFDTMAEKEILAKILTYHVVSGTAAFSMDLSDGQMINTVQGEDVTITLHEGVFIGDATTETAEVVLANVEAANGVVHIIDKVLLPQEAIDALDH